MFVKAKVNYSILAQVFFMSIKFLYYSEQIVKQYFVPWLAGHRMHTLVCLWVYMYILQFIIAQSPDNMKGLVWNTVRSLWHHFIGFCNSEAAFNFTLCYKFSSSCTVCGLPGPFKLLYTIRGRNREINIQPIMRQSHCTSLCVSEIR